VAFTSRRRTWSHKNMMLHGVKFDRNPCRIYQAGEAGTLSCSFFPAKASLSSAFHVWFPWFRVDPGWVTTILEGNIFSAHALRHRSLSVNAILDPKTVDEKGLLCWWRISCFGTPPFSSSFFIVPLGDGEANLSLQSFLIKLLPLSRVGNGVESSVTISGGQSCRTYR
jgi:hypothetical protein